MACTTGKVSSAAEGHKNALAQLKTLENSMLEQKELEKTSFYTNIDKHLADAKITDATQLEYAFNMKTEYTSEFSLDKIANVVVAALKAVAAAKDPTSPTPGMDKEALEAYGNVVNTVAEAAKSNSQSSSSISFSMSRLAPGIYAFLQAKSTSILDEDTFGSEAVSCTSIFYRIMQSIDDIKNQAKFGLAVLDAQNLIDMKVLQIGLTKRLGDGDIDIDTWVSLDSKYEGIIQGLKDRLAEHGAEDQINSKELQDRAVIHIDEARASIEKLKGKCERHQNIAALLERRLYSGHFLNVQ